MPSARIKRWLGGGGVLVIDEHFVFFFSFDFVSLAHICKAVP